VHWADLRAPSPASPKTNGGRHGHGAPAEHQLHLAITNRCKRHAAWP
jgi:hypothetical protein